MRTKNTNLIVMILLLGIGIVFSLYFLLSFPAVDTGFIIGAILCCSLIIIIHGVKTFGYRDFTVFFVIAYIVPLFYEYTDGLGFGGLLGFVSRYSELLGPKFLGKVPYVIPLAWAMFMYCAMTMTIILFNRYQHAERTAESTPTRWFPRTIVMGIVMGLFMASLDLVIDPVMVAMGAWSWSYQGLYYGIPLLNYEAWIEIPLVIFIFFSLYLHRDSAKKSAMSWDTPSRSSLVIVGLYVFSLMMFSAYAISYERASVIPWGMATVGLLSTTVVIKLRKINQG